MLTGSGARASSAPFDGCLVGKGALQGVRQRALCDDLLSERASLQLPQPLEESKGTPGRESNSFQNIFSAPHARIPSFTGP